MVCCLFHPTLEELKRITYEGTPASVIEFIATKEAVHPMKSLDDLRIRLSAGRRVLSLFHPMLENQPLLFVHVALTDHIPSSMEQVMELLPHEHPSCATFYSITNAQPGLSGIGLGEHLLKESITVSDELR
jgi:malonyl-CoA decarboxylase